MASKNLVSLLFWRATRFPKGYKIEFHHLNPFQLKVFIPQPTIKIIARDPTADTIMGGGRST
jgi:hypothetical protein